MIRFLIACLMMAVAISPAAAHQQKLAISTVSIAYFSDTLGYNHLYSFAANTAAFGFLTFLALRIFAFPLSDGRITRKERLEQYKERRRA